MDQQDALVTFRSFVTTFTDFLTVAIHTILYERNIYPQSSFLSVRKYNFAVRQNRHPKVCTYITDAVAAVETEILKGTVERVVVIIYDSTETPQERFVFDLSLFPYVPTEHQSTPLRQTQSLQQTQSSHSVYILPLVDLQEQLRATMSRLTTCSSRLKPIPDSCSFSVAIELKDDLSTDPPLGNPQPWIPVQPSKLEDPGRPLRTTPLRAVDAGYMIFESWIDESNAKSDPPRV